MQNFIEPYNPRWLAAFDDIKKILGPALNGLITDIQHVGSTAIPGLCAKPILDIDIVISNKPLLLAVTTKLQALGYIAKGEQGITGRFAFRQASAHTPLTKPVQNWQSHHLYVCYHDSLALKNHLLFKEALMGDGNLVKQYALLKQQLLKQAGITRETYTKSKTDFILSVLATLGLNTEELDAINNANV